MCEFSYSFLFPPHHSPRPPVLPFATSAHSLDPSAPPPAASSNPLAPHFPAVVPCIECPVCAGGGESQIRAAVLHGEQSRRGCEADPVFVLVRVRGAETWPACMTGPRDWRERQLGCWDMKPLMVCPCVCGRPSRCVHLLFVLTVGA